MLEPLPIEDQIKQQRTGMMGKAGGYEIDPGKMRYPPGGVLLAMGEQAIKYHYGDEINDITIVVDRSQNHPRIHGRITTEDNQPLPRLGVFVRQNGELFYGYVDEQGNYGVEWMTPGPFELHVYNDSNSPVGKPYNETINPVYEHETILQTMPEDVLNLELNIVLKRCAHLAGRIISTSIIEDGLRLIAIPSGSSSWQDARTVLVNSDGWFWVGGLSQQKTYDLYLQPQNSDEKIMVLKNVAANTDNILLSRR